MAETNPILPANRSLLYLIAFLTGLACLALEIVAFSVLAPSVGLNIYVNGAVLSVFMMGLSVGYYVGGRMGDRSRGFLPLVAAIAIVAGLVAAVPSLKGPVENLVLRQPPLSHALEAFLFAAALFLLPSVLLGFVSPFIAARLAAGGKGVGGTVGRVFMVSTVGSNAGALLTTFVGFNYPISEQLFFISVVLGASAVLGILASVLAAAAARPASAGAGLPPAVSVSPAAAPVSRLPLMALAFALPLLLGPAAAPAATEATHSDATIYEKDTFYHHLTVRDIDGKRYLIFGANRKTGGEDGERTQTYQSGMMLSDPNRSCLTYTDYFHFAFALRPKAKRIALVGCGGGSTPKEFLKNYKDIELQVVELDPEVVKVAKEHFKLPLDDKRLKVTVEDGRRFFRIAPPEQKYDVILLDAYHHSWLPFHMLTKEYFALLKEHLTDDGIIVQNLIAALENPPPGDKGKGKGKDLLHSLLKTLELTFPTVYVMPVPGYDERIDRLDRARVRNVMLFATRDKKRMSLSELEVAVKAGIEARRIADYQGLQTKAKTMLPERLEPAAGQVLTDDFAPVNHMVPIP